MKAEIKINQVSETQYELESQFTYEGEEPKTFAENWFLKDLQGFAIHIKDNETRLDPSGSTHMSLKSKGSKFVKPNETLIYKFPFGIKFHEQKVLVSFAYCQYRLESGKSYQLKLQAKNISSNFVDLKFDLP